MHEHITAIEWRYSFYKAKSTFKKDLFVRIDLNKKQHQVILIAVNHFGVSLLFSADSYAIVGLRLLCPDNCRLHFICGAHEPTMLSLSAHFPCCMKKFIFQTCT